MVKILSANAGDMGSILGWEDSLATHYSILVWEMTWTEEASGL